MTHRPAAGLALLGVVLLLVGHAVILVVANLTDVRLAWAVLGVWAIEAGALLYHANASARTAQERP